MLLRLTFVGSALVFVLAMTESTVAVARGGGGGGSYLAPSRVVTSSVRPGVVSRPGTRTSSRVAGTKLVPRKRAATTTVVQRTSTAGNCARYAQLAAGSTNAAYWKKRQARCAQ